MTLSKRELSKINAAIDSEVLSETSGKFFFIWKKQFVSLLLNRMFCSCKNGGFNRVEFSSMIKFSSFFKNLF